MKESSLSAAGGHEGGPRPSFNTLRTPLTALVSPVAQWVKNPSASAGDTRDVGSIPGSGRSPGAGNGNPLQYSCLENSKDRGAWWATVHGVAKSQTRLSAHTTWGNCVRTQGREAPPAWETSRGGRLARVQCGSGGGEAETGPEGSPVLPGQAPPGGVGVYS